MKHRVPDSEAEAASYEPSTNADARGVALPQRLQTSRPMQSEAKRDSCEFKDMPAKDATHNSSQQVRHIWIDPPLTGHCDTSLKKRLHCNNADAIDTIYCACALNALPEARPADHGMQDRFQLTGWSSMKTSPTGHCDARPERRTHQNNGHAIHIIQSATRIQQLIQTGQGKHRQAFCTQSKEPPARLHIVNAGKSKYRLRGTVALTPFMSPGSINASLAENRLQNFGAQREAPHTNPAQSNHATGIAGASLLLDLSNKLQKK